MGRPMGPPGRFGPRGFLTEEEKKNKPKVTKGMILRILSYMKPYTLQFILVFVALFISAVLGIYPSVITGKIVDEIVANGSLARVIKLIVLSFGVICTSHIVSVLEQYINSWISQMIIKDMRNQMYDHLQKMSHSFFTTEKQGDIITRMNSDISGVSSVISGTLTSLVSNFLVVATSLFYLFYSDWRLAIIGIIIIPVMILPTKAVGKKRWKLASIAQEKNDVLNQHIDETLSVSGSMLVKLFTKEKKEFETFKKINKDVTDITIKEHRTGSWFHVFMWIVIQISPLLIYFVGALLILKFKDNSLSVGDITVVVTLVNRLNMPVRMLLNIHVDFTRSLALFSRIFEYFDRKHDIVSPAKPINPDFNNAEIEFSDVRFSYERGIEILKGMSFCVPGGKKYAIVGSSGAGKSTVINMIPRLYDVTSGEVKIAGVNVKDIDLEVLRQNIGVVSQDTYLFNGTIMENLVYAKDDATKEEIIDACKKANIHDFISSLPQGYNTLVGNRGLKLSGGEKQRVSIARVILKDPKILILDEATSSLDSISESLIQSALDRIMIGRTSLIIAHRLSTVLAADCIMVTENGKISESGTHDELILKSKKYKQLYDTQFGKILEREKQKQD